MKAIILFLVFWLVGATLWPSPHGPQQNGQGGHQGRQSIKYYQVDNVKTIQGKITEIKSEKCYNDNEFMVIYVKENKTGGTFRVEVAPQWYYNMDLMTGGLIEVTGSVSEDAEMGQVMARSIMYQGQVFQFRDNMGFPLWRGQRKQMGGMGQSKKRRRGGS